jgi:hypothetical protein
VSRFSRCATIRILSAFLASAQLDAIGQDMRARVFVGYQGWSRCPGDGTPRNSWSHWSRKVPSPETLLIELYPNVNELSGRSLCALPNMTIGGNKYVFSSFARDTVEKHFEWMKVCVGAHDRLGARPLSNTVPHPHDVRTMNSTGNTIFIPVRSRLSPAFSM